MRFVACALPALSQLGSSFYPNNTFTQRVRELYRLSVRSKALESSISHRKFSSSRTKHTAAMAEIQNGASKSGAENGVLKEQATSPSKNQAKTQDPAKKEEEKPTLPKLSAADFSAYNSMAEHMEYFHNSFRRTWTLLHNACVSNKRPANLTLRQFLQTGLQFIQHLEGHHGIEEAYVFPRLAARMPEFRNTAELLRQHREIHVGMEGMQRYLEECKSGVRELELRVLKEKMDSWGGVLWKHLDEEVKTLGAENMRRYWSKEEVRRMLM